MTDRPQITGWARHHAEDIDQGCTADRHGTDDAYINAMCRCPTARDDHRRQRKRRKLKLIENGPNLRPGVGTARRLQALTVLGHGITSLARQLRMERSHVAHIRRSSHPVSRATEAKVRALYDALWRTPAPRRTPDERSAATRASDYAAAQGWLPPLAWDDDVIDDPNYKQIVNSSEALKFIVGKIEMNDILTPGPQPVDPIAIERALDGDTTIRLTRAERQAAYTTLRNRGHTPSQAGARLRLSGATSARYERLTAPISVAPATDTQHARHDHEEATG